MCGRVNRQSVYCIDVLIDSLHSCQDISSPTAKHSRLVYVSVTMFLFFFPRDTYYRQVLFILPICGLLLHSTLLSLSFVSTFYPIASCDSYYHGSIRVLYCCGSLAVVYLPRAVSTSKRAQHCVYMQSCNGDDHTVCQRKTN
jgi:hypothetical protein